MKARWLPPISCLFGRSGLKDKKLSATYVLIISHPEKEGGGALALKIWVSYEVLLSHLITEAEHASAHTLKMVLCHKKNWRWPGNTYDHPNFETPIANP